MSRLERAIDMICQSISTISALPAASIQRDEDLMLDVSLDAIELESLVLVLEEIFAIAIPENLFGSRLYRTPASLAEYCIRQSEQAAWTESRQSAQPRRMAGGRA